MKKLILCFLSLFVLSVAQAQSIEPGEYIQGDGWGYLTEVEKLIEIYSNIVLKG